MTGEDFRLLYRLGDRLTELPVVTHQATDLAGSPVLVHFLLKEGGETGTSFLEMLPRLDPAQRKKIRDVLDVDGRPTVVTEVLPGFSTFPDWLQEAVLPEETGEEAGEAEPIQAEQAPAEPEPTGPASMEPGAYTQLFKVPEEAFEGIASEEPGQPPEMPPARELSPESVDALEVSESVPAASPLEPPPVAAPDPPPRPAPPAEVEGGKAPGSYTMLFGGVGEDGSETTEDPPVSATLGAQSPGASEPPGVPDFPVPPVSPEALDSPVPLEPPISPVSQGSPIPPVPSGPPVPEVTSESPVPPASPVPPIPEAPAAPSLPPVSPEPPVPEASSEPPVPQEDLPAQPVFPSPEPPPAEAPAEPPEKASGKEKDDGPGAYTQMFSRPTAGKADPRSGGAPTTPPGQPAPPTRPAAQEPSPPDWQRWRDTPGAAGQHIPSDDYLQRLSGSHTPGAPPAGSETLAHTGKSQPPPPPAFPGGNDVPAGPGHYTMVREGFSPDPGLPPPVGRPAPTPGPPDPGAKPASMPSRRSSVLTIVGLVAVLLIIVALVVVFALVG